MLLVVCLSAVGCLSFCHLRSGVVFLELGVPSIISLCVGNLDYNPCFSFGSVWFPFWACLNAARLRCIFML